LNADEGPGPAQTAVEPRSAFLELAAAGSIRFRVTPDEPQVPEHFRLEDHTFDYQARPLRQTRAVRAVGVTFPSPVSTDVPQNNTVHAVYFQPAGPGPFPACVVLHILGGDFLLAETVANHLASRGVASLFVKMPYYGERRAPGSGKRMVSEEPQETVAGMTQAVLDIRRAAAWLESRGEVDARRLGITGISLGGIMSALAACAEPKLRNVAVVLGGGNFSEVIWGLDHPRAEAFRARWMAGGGTKESFRQALCPVDPVTYGHLLKGRRVLMVAARNDEVVPPECARALWEAAGKEPELVWLDSGHYTAIKYLPRELVRLDAFFNGSAQSKGTSP